MAKRTPWMKSSDLIASVKRKISFPISQNTFSEAEILAFANEEMFISQVPSVLEFHQEYFVYNQNLPVVQNLSRYPIPDRAIGMRLRDLMWADQAGNYFEMTRIAPEDKAFFQRNTGSNEVVLKYFLEGNEVVLTPALITQPTGSLNFTIFLRPNQLVADTRASIIESFQKTIKVDSSLLVADSDKLELTLNNNSPSPLSYLFTATNRSIVSNSIATQSIVTTAAPHNKDVGTTFQVVISEVMGSVPSINGTFIATATGANTFSIPVVVSVAGTGGFVALPTEFSIGSTSVQTAANLGNSINAAISDQMGNNNSSDTTTLVYDDITLGINLYIANPLALVTDNSSLFINFDQLPTTWTDPETNVTEDLFEVDQPVDFLQTKPGHRTYKYDINLVGISGATGQFNINDLMYYSSNGNGGSVMQVIPLEIGDYVCVANECIIPQIPPDLHNGLAERTAARILSSIGDQQGYDRVNGKIQEIDGRQGTLLDNRVEGSVQKVSSRHGLIRTFKYGRRY